MTSDTPKSAARPEQESEAQPEPREAWRAPRLHIAPFGDAGLTNGSLADGGAPSDFS